MANGTFDNLSVTGTSNLEGTTRVGADATLQQPLTYGLNLGPLPVGGFKASGLFIGHSQSENVSVIQSWSGGGTLVDPIHHTSKTIAAAPMPLALQSNGGKVGVGTTNPAARLHVDGDVRVNNQPVWLRAGSDVNHGIAYYGVQSRGDPVFAKTDLDGPVVFGYAKGALGTTAGSQKIALTWTKDGNVGIGTSMPNPANKLQVDGHLHTNGNSIFLRTNPADQFDVIRWNPQSDRVDVGGFNGVNLCATGGAASPVLTPVLSVDGAANVVVTDKNRDQVLSFSGKEAFLSIGSKNNYGDLAVLGVGGNHRVRVNGASGEVVLRDENNRVTVTISSSPGDITLAGADCAEQFEIVAGETAEPGTVLVIGSDGKLRPCSEAYDKKAAGVVSGAKGVRPGMVLNGRLSTAGCAPIALSGRVFCKVDARFGAVEVGDLLTTSPTAGHAMKAGDPVRAFGAVIGKALDALPDGEGMVPILVALQ